MKYGFVWLRSFFLNLNDLILWLTEYWWVIMVQFQFRRLWKIFYWWNFLKRLGTLSIWVKILLQIVLMPLYQFLPLLILIQFTQVQFGHLWRFWPLRLRQIPFSVLGWIGLLLYFLLPHLSFSEQSILNSLTLVPLQCCYLLRLYIYKWLLLDLLFCP